MKSAPEVCPSADSANFQRVFEKERYISVFAVIETGGKQYKVCEGDTIYVEKLEAEADSEYVFDQVKAISDDKGFRVGTPVLDGAKVTAKVIANGKAHKIYVFTYKSKKNEKTKMGHRQPFTKVEIVKIEG